MFKWFFENVLQDNFWAEGGRKLSVVASIWLYLYIFTEKVLKQENMNTKRFEKSIRLHTDFMRILHIIVLTKMLNR